MRPIVCKSLGKDEKARAVMKAFLDKKLVVGYSLLMGEDEVKKMLGDDMRVNAKL